MDINKIILIGRCSNEPVIKKTKSGKVAEFGLATNRFYYKKNGEKKSVVKYHDIVAWNKLADVVEKYIVKGKTIYIEGRTEADIYEDNGVKIKRDIVVAEVIQLIKDNQ